MERPKPSKRSDGDTTIALTRHTHLQLWLFARLGVMLVVLGVSLPALAQESLVPEVAALKSKPLDDDEFRLPVDKLTGIEIDKLIVDLRSPDYHTREAATESLISIGATAFAKLRDAYAGSDDFDLRVTIEGIVKIGYLTHHVFNKTGFLGMQQSRQPPLPSHDTDKRIPEGSYGIRIGRVIENTGAERAGLQKNDIIIEMDGLPLEGTGLDLFANFSAKIRKTGPGGQLNLTILRPDDGVFDVTATLGPVQRSSFNSVTGMREIIPIVDERFFRWWELYFRQHKLASLSGDAASEDVAPSDTSEK